MDLPAQRIRDAMQAVSLLRQIRASSPQLDAACLDVKRFQAQRFRATYADLLHSPRYQGAAHFFLSELYGDHDYAQRDQQFARIANTIARLFPAAVVETAASLAEVHALTERLDDLVARQWLMSPHLDLSARYISCWRAVGDRSARAQQLQVVLHLGQQLDRLTKTRGLRMLLRMMRAPAQAGGLSALQNFLEAGFDAFAEMRGASQFLSLIESRESIWIASLFDDQAVACETRLNQLLAEARSH
ncbi:MAG TPA: hypothetical protein VE934_04950 [Polaromonas sp.]|uniref:FFLEELY motif protein n=1 Tax=Polaromonas sp. TaxID=1869339 RepID=UPI002D5EF974|nr:hypothetical protein [Polaromonas sp.]HYW56284.1 hypothetical protein [Polaromonas sp.]